MIIFWLEIVTCNLQSFGPKLNDPSFIFFGGGAMVLSMKRCNDIVFAKHGMAHEMDHPKYTSNIFIYF